LSKSSKSRDEKWAIKESVDGTRVSVKLGPAMDDDDLREATDFMALFRDTSMMTATTKIKDQCHWQNPIQRLAALPKINMVVLYFGEKAKPFLLNMCNRIYVSQVVVKLDKWEKQKV
jgi:hypothetical protein